MLTSAMQCERSVEEARQDEGHNPLQIADLGEAVRDDATPSESAPRRTRTFNPLIKS